MSQSLAGVTVDGKLEGLEHLVIESARIDLGQGTVFDVTGDLEMEKRGVSAQASIDLKTISVERIATLWPAGIAGGIHNWIADHIPAGNVEDIHVELAVGPAGNGVALRKLDGSFSYEGLRLDLFPKAPPIEQITGSATFNARAFDFAIAGARFADLEVTESSAIISHLDDPPTRLSVDATVSGPVNTALAMVNGTPFDLVDPSIIAAADVGGTATTEVRVALPVDGPSSGEVESFDIRSTLNAFSWSKAPLGLKASQGDLSLRVDPKHLEAKGNLQFNGVPGSVIYGEYFSGNDLLRRIEARARVDDPARKALGLPSLPFLTGTAALELTYTADRRGLTIIDGKADLGDTTIEAQEIGWTKPAGAPATLTATAREFEGRWTIDPVRLSATDLSADARIRLEGGPPVLRGFWLKNFTYAKQNFGGSLEVQSDDVLAIRVRGASVDLEPLTRTLHSGLESGGTDTTVHKDLPAFDLEVELDEVFGARGVSFGSVVAGATFDGRLWRKVELTASTRPTGRISLVLGPAAEGYSLHLDVSDLGQVVDSLGLAAVFRGGDLDLALEGPSNGPFEGQLVVQDTHLIQSDTMTRLLRMASLQGLLASFSSSGLNINRIRTDLRWENRQLKVSDLRIHADGLGITANGKIDFGGARVDLHGALAPAATLQRIIGHIPLLGQILTGINREGVIATEFSITGPLKAPEIKTKPLSTLTPGITRDLFRLKPEQDEPAPN